MIISEDKPQGQHSINAYSEESVTIDGVVYSSSLILSKNTLILDWPPHSLNDLKPQHWDSIISMKPDILIFGTGVKSILPKAALLAPLYNAQIGVEAMSTGAACRTYMALLAEDRNVVLALLMK